METNLNRRRIGLLASQQMRENPSGPFLRLMRDHSQLLQRFQIYATGGTAKSLRATGLYSDDQITTLRNGATGGVVEMAALVARRELEAVIFLSDPNDPMSGSPENYALRRVCMQHEVRLISTLASAEHWIVSEASRPLPKKNRGKLSSVFPRNWKEGTPSEGALERLPIGEQTIALIAHDKHGMKERMVTFVDQNMNILSRFDRILATGTTGGLLRKRYASSAQQKALDRELASLGTDRVAMIDDTLKRLPRRPRASELLVKKIMQLPSGPKGGDILIANEVLKTRCQVIVFFQDPQEAHPHEPDIRLLERTCQLPGSYAECVSDAKSAAKWIESTRSPQNQLSPPQVLRAEFGLREAIIVATEMDKDGEELGRLLARAAAGYLDKAVRTLAKRRERLVIAVSYGWGTAKVLTELERMRADGLINDLSTSSELVWVPLIGLISVQWTEQEAAQIARGFARFYGGEYRPLSSTGFALTKKAVEQERETLSLVNGADLVLTSAAPWDKAATLAKNTGLDRRPFPSYSEAVGMVSGVFLDARGEAAKSGYHVVGMQRQGFRSAAREREVILVCGGRKRRRVALAALRAGMASVLVTNKKTAEWLAQQGKEGPKSRRSKGRTGKAKTLVVEPEERTVQTASSQQTA